MTEKRKSKAISSEKDEEITMSSDNDERDAKGINRRGFLMAGAAGAAGLAAAGLALLRLARRRHLLPLV